jgi:23S rRNA pseudouridine2605 synthase
MNEAAPKGLAPRHGIARVLSKLGLASRTESARWVRAGRVRVNGRLVRDPEFPVTQGRDVIVVDDCETVSSKRRVIMLNKPRGLVTTAADDQGRATVYRCLDGAGLPWLAPVGRLDKASEGLLLFTNDPAWAAGITAPESALDKTYHVQIDRLPDEGVIRHMVDGIDWDGRHLSAKSVRCLGRGAKNAWLEIVLDEGRNRHIRRLLAAIDASALRLVRTAIGSLPLGELGKGQWRELGEDEIHRLERPAADASRPSR